MAGIEQKQKKEFLPPNTRALFLPVLYLVIIAAVSFIAIKIGIDKISDQQKSLKQAQKLENTLSEKESELRESRSILSSYVKPANMALPDTNPSLYLISHFNDIEEAKEDVSVEDFKVSGSSTKLVGKTVLSISYTVYGPHDQMLSFLRETEKIAPIVTYGTINIALSEGFSSADISASSHWAPYPEDLPAMSTPIDKLSNEDMQLLKSLVNLRQPDFFDLTAVGAGDRSNPFGL